MANYLFTLTIANVQSFIAQARQSQDLFAGSQILSQLIGKALDEFKKDTVIFPQNKESVSNKIVVKLENRTEKQIKEIGEKLEKCINQECVITILETTRQGDESLNNFFQIFWVAVELTDNYQASYQKLERNLGAVKNLRSFHQEGQIAGKQKCSLCGERNFVKKESDDALCLVCLTKRQFNKKTQNFPTLSDIVVLHKEDKPENAHQYLSDNPHKKKHYALIHFDIDDLGKTLNELNEQEQKDLSTALGDFAQKAKDIVDKRGKTIYAGGDDFLGLVNLAYLFKVIDELYCDFESFNLDLTFSTSIIIAHYKAPLHKVLDFSRSLLEESKNHFEDKNGMGVMVMSSNTIISKTICRYEYFKLLEALKKEEFAKNLPFKLAQIFDYLGEMSFDEFLTQKQMIQSEIKRLLKREEREFNQKLYEQLINFLDKQGIELSTNNYTINFENFIGYLKTLEQLRKVMP